MNSYKLKYAPCFEEGMSIAQSMLADFSEEKAFIVGEILGAMFLCGKEEFRVDSLIFEDINKFSAFNQWCLEQLSKLKNLGCSEKILASTYLNLWDRSEGRTYIDILNHTTRLEIADCIRQLTGFPGPFYALCLIAIHPKEIEFVYTATERKMRFFINDINDIVSLAKDKRMNVLNSLAVLNQSGKSAESRILSNISDIFCIIKEFEQDTIEKLATFMMKYIIWHLESARYAEMGSDIRNFCHDLIYLISGYVRNRQTQACLNA